MKCRLNWNQLFRSALLVVAALAGMFAAVALFSTAHFSVSAFEFSAEIIPFQRGDTIIFIPPVGELRAATHWFPFMLKVTLLNVDLDTLVVGLENLAASQNITYFEEQVRSRLAFFLLRNTAIVFLCSAGAVYLPARLRSWRRALISGLIASVLFLTLFYATVLRPYNIEAFETPQYKGIIGAAPWVVNISNQTIATIKTLGEQLEVMTANLHDLSEQLDRIQLDPPHSGLRVLHVSDIHNNPAAFDFIEKVVISFNIDFIIDTGDLTDYGTELETDMVSRVSSLPVPYLFVPGNHDSPQVIETMQREGAIILGNELIELMGLRIAGVADPSSESSLMAIAPEQVLRETAATAYLDYASGEDSPDIIAVHHPLTGSPFIGVSPVILSGHTHRAQVLFEQGSALINAGTTGAAGVRGLQAPLDNPYSMVVLYFSPDPEGYQTLMMADLLSIQQHHDSFSLKRHYNR